MIEIGDWVRVNTKRFNISGEVEETSPRLTRIVSRGTVTRRWVVPTKDCQVATRPQTGRGSK